MNGQVNPQVQAMISQLSPIDIRAQLFKNRDFDFIVKQEANGEIKEHKKQRQALEILTSNKYSEFLYGGGAGCYPKGTEFFNGKCWKPIESYSSDDMVLDYDPKTGKSKLVKPTRYISTKSDSFYTIKNRRVDFTTSKYHKHLVLNQKNNKIETIRTHELLENHNKLVSGNKKTLLNSFLYESDGVGFSEMEIRLRIAIMADGHLLPIKNGSKFRINLKKERKIKRLKWLLSENNIDYKLSIKDDGFHVFTFYFHSDEKEFQDYWYKSSLKEKEIICEEVLLWDGSVNERKGNRKKSKTFFSTSKKTIDFVQFAFSSIGQSAILSENNSSHRKNTLYELNISYSKGLGIQKNSRTKNTTKIYDIGQLDGKMYCFEVETGFFVVRQKGSVFVSGNSAKSWTGCVWLLFMGINYPGTRYFVARNELKALEESVLVTFHKVCKEYGYSDYKYNAVKHYITLGNGSVINFVEIKRQPSDPLFETLGSTEYTAGWIEEVGEIDETGAQVLSKRAGRHMNDKYGINKIIFYTCNPKKNWAKREFYDKWKKGELESFKCYLPALVLDNPFIEKSYAKDLESYKTTNKVLYERLYKGNWDYEDNPYQLTDDEMIDAMFSNNHVNKDQFGNPIAAKRYITADVARFGSDKARIGYWEGWDLKEVISLDISKTTDVELAIRTLRFKYRVPRTRAIGDADGVGGGVIDGAGIKGFNNNARPIRTGKNMPNYKNLQVQCLYHLAERINHAEINISADLTNAEREEIKEEMSQIQSKGEHDPERKLDCKSKADIKDAIGRSPDFRDMMLMRSFFDLKKGVANLTTTWN